MSQQRPSISPGNAARLTTTTHMPAFTAAVRAISKVLAKVLAAAGPAATAPPA